MVIQLKYAKNNFINNEQILSTLIENNEGDNEDSVKYNGNVYIHGSNNDNNNGVGLILPPAKYIKDGKIYGFANIERVIIKNEHKINIFIKETNGEKRDDTIKSMQFITFK